MQDSHHSLHKLHSLEYVAGLFSPEGKPSNKHVKEVERLARKAGTYVAFGDVMLFADRDIAAFVEWLRPRGTGKTEPLDTEDVVLVVIGHNLDANAEVFVGWSYPGGVDDLHQSVLVGCPGVHVLDWRACTYGVYKQHLQTIQAERSIGRWYHRTPAMNAWLLSTFATGVNDNSDDEQL